MVYSLFYQRWFEGCDEHNMVGTKEYPFYGNVIVDTSQPKERGDDLAPHLERKVGTKFNIYLASEQESHYFKGIEELPPLVANSLCQFTWYV